MKYAAIITLAILGLIELVLRGAITICLLLMPLVFDDHILQPWCFRMAEKVLAS